MLENCLFVCLLFNHCFIVSRVILLKTTVPFGDAVLSTLDTCVGIEICEELWNPKRLAQARL